MRVLVTGYIGSHGARALARRGRRGSCRSPVLALEYLAGGGASGILNLGAGKGHTVKEVVATIERVIGHELKKRIAGRRPGDPPALLSDPSRAEKLLGWKATRSLEDMVSSAWKFMQLHGHRSQAACER
jgi:UDP-glucose 4-epimerase